MSACLFIRNDDVWTLDREFRFFFDQAMERAIPVVHAVIPGKMDQKLIRFLCRAKEKTPQLLDIVQHGWVHANHCLDGESKYEFGPLRDYKTQHTDIHKGLEKMRLAFRDHFTPAFVPPYHGFDQSTIRVLHEEAFKIFSAGMRQSGRGKGMLEIPAQVSFSRYDKGRKSILPALDVIGHLARGIHRRTLSGVLTHHADFSNARSHKELTKFFDSIVSLKSKKGWRVLLFSDILSVSKGA